MQVAHVDAAAAALEDPEAVEKVWRTRGGKRIFVGLKVELSKVGSQRCQALIERAWRDKAPKRLAASYEKQR